MPMSVLDPGCEHDLPAGPPFMGGVEMGQVMDEVDRLVKALLKAIATLEDLVELLPESTTALSTLEGIAYELGEMAPDECQKFIDVLECIATDEPSRAAWIRGLPRMLGLIDQAQS